MLANNFRRSTCFANFELIKFMCFGSTLSYPHSTLSYPQKKEFLNPHPPCKCGYPQPARVNPPRAGL